MEVIHNSYSDWIRAVNICADKGWECVNNWIFKDPMGLHHDLSAANLNRLDYIMEKGLFLVG